MDRYEPKQEDNRTTHITAVLQYTTPLSKNGSRRKRRGSRQKAIKPQLRWLDPDTTYPFTRAYAREQT
jgi:hypothetical protein